MVVNPFSPDALPEIRDVQATARANGLQLRLLNASTAAELDAAFTTLETQRPDALLMGGDPFYIAQARQIIERIERAPAWWRFMRFASSPMSAAWSAMAPTLRTRIVMVGIYVGRILKGANPADLPVLQPTTFELVINLKTAKAQGIDIPSSLHARSDEVIE
jgi:putative ABC transport system substrate-binding protein